jgi:L-threonylcarbamoyladenylate synthase
VEYDVTQFEYVRPRSRSGLLSLSEAGLVADNIKRGGLAVLPTETGYMLAALATSEAAVRQVFTVKQRSTSNVMHVACSSLKMAEQVGVLGPPAMRLMAEFTPGPVTVVVDKTPLLPDQLVTLNGTVGIRIPDHSATLQIVSIVGAPVTATSLNRSGFESAPLDKFDMQFLEWPGNGVVYVLEDDQAITHKAASTLVRVTGESVEILRPGPIDAADIRRVAGATGGG